jgi:hypothetical protein
MIMERTSRPLQPGSRYAVAKAANAIAVKVASDADGAFASDIVAGIH